MRRWAEGVNAADCDDGAMATALENLSAEVDTMTTELHQAGELLAKAIAEKLVQSVAPAPVS